MSEAELPDPTRVEGAPHPRDTLRLYGQEKAEAGFLDAWNSGRLHHAWMLRGPRGIGKATLAWRIARFLLQNGAAPAETGGGRRDSLDTDPDSPLAHRIAAGGEPRIFVLKRGENATGSALSQDIRVDEVRRLKSFLQLSAADGGHRVVIVDAADEMNPQAENALLKLLEEPPARVTFLLIAHQPARLLPTVRSRCRDLRLDTLPPEGMARALAGAGVSVGGAEDGPEGAAEAAALTALAEGSVGEAVRLARLDGLETYATLIALLMPLPRLDRPRALAFADRVSGRQDEEKLDLALGLIGTLLSRLAKGGLQGPPATEGAPGEAKLITRLSPNGAAALKWAALHQDLGARARHGQAVNLDPAALVMDMLLAMTAASA